jgi:anaerobic magnesium-protoporphyrin IX monomethyl ester cyclase
MGGVHPTLFHESLVKDGVCDLVVRGEGEDTVLEIVQGKPLREVASLTWRDDKDTVVVNPDRDTFVDLEALPFPLYDKLPMTQYHSALGAARRSPSIGIITSRGCPGKCTFCYSGMYGSKIRMMSAQKVVEQMLLLKNKYGIREISFYDDTFTVNKKRVRDICNLLQEKKASLSWSCFARVDTVDLELLKLMRKSGCHQISYGFESVDEEILKAVNKKVNAKSIDETVALTREAGIDVRGAFMLGNSGETEASMRRTIDYAKRAKIRFAMFNITTPFPGTELYRWAKENNYISHYNWSEYDLAHTVLELPTVSSKAVSEHYKLAYNEFYMRPSYVINSVLSIRTLFELKTHIKAFFGIMSTMFTRRSTDK